MFPYPSGAGLHLGHYYNYAIVDSYCRYLRWQGEEVFQPFGYDAFGLPAENYARSVGGDPRAITIQNIDNFRQQMARMNTQFTEKLVTCTPEYIKWTQWIFTKLLKHDLAYKKFGSVNWCPSCETVLANEQVKENHCDRCAAKIEEREMNQWYFKITEYRDRLLSGLEKINYPDGTIKQQRLWLENLQDWCVSRQRKWGCPIPLDGETDTLDTFVDSSFYYLRYLTDSADELIPKKDYRPIDLYVGGAEHACMHLIYARFIHYFLYDIGIVPQEEPFNQVIHQGMITRSGAKMGKSKGNALSPDDFDPDELRMFLMFLGPYTEGGDWNDRGIVGIRRFIGRMKTWLSRPGEDLVGIDELAANVKKHMTNWKVNRVVSSFMEFYNNNKDKKPRQEQVDKIVSLLRNFAPGFVLS